MTLTAAGSPYLITRDITILPPGSLSIEAGVVIEVKANTGILVEGSMTSLGSSISPVTFRPQSVPSGQQNDSEFRIADGYYSGDDESGTLQVNFHQFWRTICLPSNVSKDYTSLRKLADLACKRLGYTRGSDSTRTWFPSLGTPIITKFSCPGNATDISRCTFSSQKYSASSRCLSIFYVRCYDIVSVNDRQLGRMGRNSIFSNVNRLRFKKQSCIAFVGAAAYIDTRGWKMEDTKCSFRASHTEVTYVR